MSQKGSRQQPGFACEECRRRKTRCDRVRPTCGPCIETGRVCVTSYKSSLRSPRTTSQLNAMRLQIANLQWQLNQLGHDHEMGREHTAPETVEAVSPDASLSCLDDSACVDVCLTSCTSPIITPLTQDSGSSSMSTNFGWGGWTSDLSAVEIGLSPGTGDSLTDLPVLVAASNSSSNVKDANSSLPVEHIILAEAAAAAPPVIITDDILADLDQIFMERVHPILPFIYWRRYFSWADLKNPGAARACLRSAMRTLAAAMSASSTRFCEHLYAETCKLLQGFPISCKDDIAIEYIQSWLLLGHFELLRVGEHQAILTASRCCRLVLMARLLHIDGHGALSGGSGEMTACTFSDIEERRRTFWLSFLLDRLLCSRNEYPLGLQDELIYIRLPAPETNFQNNQPICTGFLSETITLTSPLVSLSPLAECVVLATIHGRCATYSPPFTLNINNTMTISNGGNFGTETNICETDDGGGGDFFWTSQRWLAAAVEKRLQALSSYKTGTWAPVDDSGGDSMLLFFAHMLAHSAVIKLGQMAHQRASLAVAAPSSGSGISSLSRPSCNVEEHLRAAAPFEQEAMRAAVEVVRLARQMPLFGCFKLHPFLPDLLGSTASYLTSKTNGNASLATVSGGTKQLLRVLKDMQSMNCLARDYLQRLIKK